MAKPNQSTKPRGVAATLEGIKKIKQKIAELEKQETQESNKKVWTQDYIAERAGVSLSTYKRFIAGNPVEPDYVTWITGVFGLRPEDVISPDEWNQAVVNLQPRQNNDIDWHLVCSKTLKKQQETQRLRSKATERGFEVNIDDVHLGLVERKQQQRRTGNIEAKQLNRLEAEVIIKTHQHDEFLQRFTEQKQGNENRHTAIIGEAGAGKTTLLSKIASYIQENTENLFVFISLSNLEGRNLHEYILKQWLFEAIGASYPEIDVTPEIENKFIKLFRQGSVWLLLDGVDEMPKTTPLHWIESQLTDWLNDVRVVLTCRNNVWDASVNNGMMGFDTFKAQDFEPEQVNQFIENWFKLADDKQQGDLLKAKLKETGRERIRDLIRNPLRLSLLCQTFYANKADLPETKAALYKRFILYLQEWKQHLYSIKRETQGELHKALGKLALAGINSETKFRFRESVARQEMDNNLFELACKVNWLHPVDRDIQHDEPAFAFFHPNFQEYFAALAIPDMSYFLNHVPHKPEKGSYRIFETKWKEVFLLCLGRDDIQDGEKENFINQLVTFNDDCKNAYGFQAHVLAAVAITEFKNYSQANAILKKIITYCFGFLNTQKQSWSVLIKTMRQEARSALLETDRVKALEVLHEVIPEIKDDAVHNEASTFLRKLSPQPVKTLEKNNVINILNNLNISMAINIIKKIYEKDDYANSWELTWELSEAISYLEENIAEDFKAIQVVEKLLDNTNNEVIRLRATMILKGVSSVKANVIITLVELIKTSEDESTRLEAAVQLREIESANKHVFGTLNSMLDSLDENIRLQAAQELEKIDSSNQQIIKVFIDIVETSQDQHVFSQAIEALENLCNVNPQAKLSLIQLLEPKYKGYIRLEAANSLAKIAPELKEYITETVLYLFRNFDTAYISPSWVEYYDQYVESGYYSELESILEKIAVGYLQAIEIIIELLPTGQNYCWRIPSILKKIAFAKEEAIIKLKQLFQSSHDDTTSYLAANSLLQVDPMNLDAIDALARIVESAQDKSIRQLASEDLWQMGQGNTNVLNTLIEKVCESSLGIEYRNYTWSILCTKHDNNPDTINPMINMMLDSNCNNKARYLAIRELEEMGVDNLLVRDAFARLMNTETDEDIRWQAASTWTKINPGQKEAIDTAVDVLTILLKSPSRDDYSRLGTAQCLEKFVPNHLDSTKAMIDLLLNSNEWEEHDWDADNYLPSVVKTAAEHLEKIHDKERLIFTLKHLKQWITSPNSAKDARRRSLCYSIILHYAKNISYPEFFKAWHGESSPTQYLESQFASISLQLKATNKTFPILLNAHALQNETNTIAISQEICNQIYFIAFPDAEPPEVNNAPQIKRFIPRIKKQLRTKNLALIFNNCQPNQELIAFCCKITDVVSIAWITDEPLEAPLRGFPPNQPNLLNAIQNWINEIE